MSGSVNKVILIGNLVKDPEVRNTQSGKKVVNLNVATSDSWKDKQTGERKEQTEWHRVVIYSDGLACIAEKYLSKGSKVYIEGSLQTRKWTDKDGQEKYSTEVVLTAFVGVLTLLDFADKEGVQKQEQKQTGGFVSQAELWERSQSNKQADLDDDIPF